MKSKNKPIFSENELRFLKVNGLSVIITTVMIQIKYTQATGKVNKFSTLETDAKILCVN